MFSLMAVAASLLFIVIYLGAAQAIEAVPVCIGNSSTQALQLNSTGILRLSNLHQYSTYNCSITFINVEPGTDIDFTPTSCPSTRCIFSTSNSDSGLHLYFDGQRYLSCVRCGSRFTLTVGSSFRIQILGDNDMQVPAEVDLFYTLCKCILREIPKSMVTTVWYRHYCLMDCCIPITAIFDFVCKLKNVLVSYLNTCK